MGNGNGKFIVVEGPDGVGKSTSVKYMAAAIQAKYGVEVICTRLPGGTPEGERIREIFKRDAANLSIKDQVCLLVTAKRHLLDLIVRPAIERGAYVIADRYVDSLMAYQWAGFSSFNPRCKEQIEAALLFEQIDVFPDIKIVMECPVDLAEARMISDTRAADSLDSAGRDFKLRVRTYFEHFLTESPQGHTFRVDSSGSLPTVEKQLQSIINAVL